MPESLVPGVYVEEVSFRAKSIEGVPTSTTGFAGVTRLGPVPYRGGPWTTPPRLVTSFTEFERVFGGLEPVKFGTKERLPYLAHAARAFFLNGGKRLYVARVFVPSGGLPPGWRESEPDFRGVARLEFEAGTRKVYWRARWPGAAGNVRVQTKILASGDVAFADVTRGVVQARGVQDGSVVEVLTGDPPPSPGAIDPDLLYRVAIDPTGRQTFQTPDGQHPVGEPTRIRHLTLQVEVAVGRERRDRIGDLTMGTGQARFIGRILERDEPEDADAAVWLDLGDGDDLDPVTLLLALGDREGSLEQGDDGELPSPDDLAGQPVAADDSGRSPTGLCALAEVDDIAIVALPDGGAYGGANLCVQAAERLITHAEQLRYRIALVDGPPGSSLDEIRAFRGELDSSHAALYHPWVAILDPLEQPSLGVSPRRLLLPPSGFVAGIYARTDTERGVQKAPANEVVREVIGLEVDLDRAGQAVLNPEGINALRFLEGRGYRVEGARTLTADPEWKYVNVRRFLDCVEHSIDRGTRWAVFEPNKEPLWAKVREVVEGFLLGLWKGGALLGSKPEEAFFVRCDRTTMTQNDLDNGRLVCLIGLAPTKPAEFVIFRIGQRTADATA